MPPGEHFHTVLGSPEAFKSPVTGEEISDRGRLRRHNKEHGITDIRDYGPGYFQRKAVEQDLERRGQTKAAKQDRIEIIKRVVEQQQRN